MESLWRYPVKSMAGEERDEFFVRASGMEGDRVFAFSSSAKREDFPYFTGREQHAMLQYRPRLRPSRNGDALTAEVETPAGATLSIDDPALVEVLREDVAPEHLLTLLRSERALTDAYPLSIFSVQTAAKIADEIGMACDKRRFRANIYLDLPGTHGFAEDKLVGHSVRIGREVVLAIAKRDTRCMMITIDPETAARTPALLKKVAQDHAGTAGVYATVLVEGILRKGDSVALVE